MADDSEPHRLLMNIQEKAVSEVASGNKVNHSICGFEAMVVLQRRYGIGTDTGMLQEFKQVARPQGVKDHKDVIAAINGWEQRVTLLQTRYKEQI